MGQEEPRERESHDKEEEHWKGEEIRGVLAWWERSAEGGERNGTEQGCSSVQRAGIAAGPPFCCSCLSIQEKVICTIRRILATTTATRTTTTTTTTIRTVVGKQRIRSGYIVFDIQ